MSKLRLSLLILTLAVTGLPVAAQAQPLTRPPTVHLDTYTGKPTHTFRLGGEGFAAGESVDIYLGPQTTGPLDTVAADGDGALASRVETIPMVAPGDYTLTFVGRASQMPASVGLNVQGFHPWVVLDNYYIDSNDSIGYRGEDFVPGESVQIYLNSTLSQAVTTVNADSDGRIADHAFQLRNLTNTNQLIFAGQQSQTQVTAAVVVAAGGN
jgi:5-hydroxyisourate hydrolase-like protein (transthyretin family)